MEAHDTPEEDCNDPSSSPYGRPPYTGDRVPFVELTDAKEVQAC